MKSSLHLNPNRRVRLVIGLGLVFSIPFARPIYSNPAGPTVRHGDISITGAGGNLQIHQSTAHGIIDWQTFSIQNGEVTRFIQPGASAVTLNRVTGQSLSSIDGSLLANGRIILLNPNGVMIGRNGMIDTGGFTASTLDLSDQDFLAGGDLRLKGNSTAGIVNLGSINAVDGDVFLIAASVVNSGSISARNGSVGLAAGNDVLIAESGSERIFVRGAGAASDETGVINRGTVEANVAELKSYGGNIYGMAVRNEGRVAATAVSREGGQIFLRAGGGKVRSSGSLTARKQDDGGTVTVDSGSEGSTEVSGSVDAGSGIGDGGRIVILGSKIELFDQSLIIADGAAGGGHIFIGGGKQGLNPDFNNAREVNVASGSQLSAEGLNSGDGGQIVVFAEGTLEFSGKLSVSGSKGSSGGFAELSGQEQLFTGSLNEQVDLGAANGPAGTLLIDPVNINVTRGAGGGVTGTAITDGAIVSFLADTGNLIIDATAGTGGDGDITLAGDVNITWGDASDLSFIADRDFIVGGGAVINSTGSGAFSATATRAISLGSASSIETKDGNLTLIANAAGTLSGDFTGITLGGTLATVGDGDIRVTGTGGNGVGNYGILINGSLSSTGTGVSAGTITIDGTSRSSDATGDGILLNQGVSSIDGRIELNGVSALGKGINLNGAAIRSTGTGDEAASITLTGTGNGSDGFSSGMFFDSSNLNQVTSFDGDISITGTTDGLAGVFLNTNGLVASTGDGSITVDGSNSSGTAISSTGTDIAAVTGKISLLARGDRAETSLSGATIGGSNASGDILFVGNEQSWSSGLIVQSSGSLTIAPRDAGTNIGLGGEEGTLNLTETELGFLQEGFRSITIGDTDGFGIVRIGTATFQDPLTILTPENGDVFDSGEIYITGLLKGTGNASITLDGAGPAEPDEGPATTYLSGSIVTQGQRITIADDVIVAEGSLLDTTESGNFENGADVVVTGTVKGISFSEFFELEIDAGKTGTIDLQDTVGVAGPSVGDLTFKAGHLNLYNRLSTRGVLDISVAETLSLNAPILSFGGVTVETAGEEVQVNSFIELAPDDPAARVSFISISETGTNFLIDNDLSGLSQSGQLFFTGTSSAPDSVLFKDTATFGAPYSISESQLEGIDFLTNEYEEGFFHGSENLPATFTFTGTNEVDYQEGSKLITISGFDEFFGGSGDDVFTFEEGGSAYFVDGGSGIDTVDFSNFGSEIAVDLDYRSVSDVDFADYYTDFDNVENFSASINEFDNAIYGTTGGDEVTIEGNSRGFFKIPTGEEEETRKIDFSGFLYVDSWEGDDKFLIEFDGNGGTLFDGTLAGAEGDDQFFFNSNGFVDEIKGGSIWDVGEKGFDTIDFSGSSFAYVYVDLEEDLASGVGDFDDIDHFAGGGIFGADLSGTEHDDFFTITGSNSGYVETESSQVPLVSFTNFDFIDGAEGNDLFTINLSGPETEDILTFNVEVETDEFPEAPVFVGALAGGEGTDTFRFVSGQVAEIIGGDSGDFYPDEDVLDFSDTGGDLLVELGSEVLRALTSPGEKLEKPELVTFNPGPVDPVITGGSGVQSFSGIETVAGGNGENTLLGTETADEVYLWEGGNGEIYFVDPDPFIGSEVSSITSFTLDDVSAPMTSLNFESFTTIDARGGDDEFYIEVFGAGIDTSISGGEGSDFFGIEYFPYSHSFSSGPALNEFEAPPSISEVGSLAFLDGGEGGESDIDVLSFEYFEDNVFVDISRATASGVMEFDGIERVEGGYGENDILIGTADSDVFTLGSNGNRLEFGGISPGEINFAGFENLLGNGGEDEIVGTEDEDRILINGEGQGEVLYTALVPFGPGPGFDLGPVTATAVVGFEKEPFGEGPELPEFTEIERTIRFEEIGTISAGGGDDEFTIDIPNSDSFSGVLNGDSGNDLFVMNSGGGVGSIDGGSEVDTLDFSGFSSSVSVDLEVDPEAPLSPPSYVGTATQVDLFKGVESVIGGAGEDTLSGTEGADQFLVDRDNGGLVNGIDFDGFEILQGRGGNDQFRFTKQAVVSRFAGGAAVDTFILDDSNLGGTNTYIISGNSVSRNPFYLFSEIEFLQFFLGSGNDTVITDDNGLIQLLNGGGGNDTIDFGTTPVIGRAPFLFGGSQVFETGFENFIFVRDESNNPDNVVPQVGGGSETGDGSLIDQFSNTGGLGEALGNAFGALAGSALLAGQASVIQVDGGQYQLQAPASLDGFFTQPPPAIIELLNKNLEVDAWTELADSIDFSGATILVLSDGPYSISLDGVPPNEVMGVLAESLLADPAKELIEALELAFVVPITSIDGAVSILTVPVVIDPASLRQLLLNLDESAYSELTSALGD